MPDEYKKTKPPTFDGEMKKPQDAKAWLLGMRKFFKLHEYSENMKSKIATFNLKGKVEIWWEDMKNVRCIHEGDLTWSELRDYSRRNTYQRDTLMIGKKSSMS